VADQPIVASQVESLGCGISLDGERATPAEIKEAVDRLLVNPSYAASARVLAKTISQGYGVSAAVTELETLLDRRAAVIGGAE